MRLLILLILISLFLAIPAHALEVCWDDPTENTDGSPITDLPLRYAVYYGTTSREYPFTILTTDPDGDKCHSWSPEPGTYFIALTAIDSDGDESAYSNEVVKTQIGAPLPPIIIESEQTVFNVVKQPDRFVLLPVGLVPAGTQCDPNNAVNGHGAVPVDDVVWQPGVTVRPIVVVALCDG